MVPVTASHTHAQMRAEQAPLLEVEDTVATVMAVPILMGTIEPDRSSAGSIEVKRLQKRRG